MAFSSQFRKPVGEAEEAKATKFGQWWLTRHGVSDATLAAFLVWCGVLLFAAPTPTACMSVPFMYLCIFVYIGMD